MQPRYICARTSYFAVEDESLFLIWIETLPGVVARRREHPSSGAAGQPVYALIASPKGTAARSAPTASEMGLSGAYGFPKYRIGAGDGLEEIDLADEIAHHLRDGDCVLIVEASTSAHPTAVSSIKAVHSSGDVRNLDFSEIFGRAADAGWTLPYSAVALPTDPAG